jgi:hypothetical protein
VGRHTCSADGHHRLRYRWRVDPKNVTVTVSPAAATVVADGQVTLQADVKGLCSTWASMIQQWSIAEDPSGGASRTFYQPVGLTIEFCKRLPPLTAEQFTRDLGGSFRAVRDTLVHIFRGEWIEKATGRPVQSGRISHRRCGAAEGGGNRERTV